MKLAIISTNYGAALHVGGGVETDVKLFDLSPEAIAEIERARATGCSTVSLGIHDEPKARP